MAIKFKVIARKSPKDKTVKYYGSIQHARIGERQFIENIVQKNTCTRADVLAVIASVKEELVSAIRSGMNVTLPEIGTFTCSMKTKGAPTKTAFNAAEHIKSLHVRFQPCSVLRYDCSRKNPLVKFENVEQKEEEP